MAAHLVIQLARFGDMLQTKRLLLSLAAEGDEVHLAVDTGLAPLARIVYPFAQIHAVAAHAGNVSPAEVLSANRRVFGELAAIPFASVTNCNFSGMALALAGLFDPDAVRGYVNRNGQAGRSRWLKMGFRWMGDRRAAPMNLVDFWAHLHPDPVRPETVNPDAADGKHGRIAVALSGREARRSLPPEVLGPIVEAVFAARGGPEIILLGGASDRAAARRLCRSVSAPCFHKMTDLCGETALTDLPGILAFCDGLYTPDTGIMHLAAHLGVQAHAFFLSSAWCFETGPYGRNHILYQSVQDCAPCAESKECELDTRCLPPFSSQPFLAHLRGVKDLDTQSGIARLRTDFDEFGCVMHGDLPGAARRSRRRTLLAEFVGRGVSPMPSGEEASVLFHETDWILPGEGESVIPGRGGE